MQRIAKHGNPLGKQWSTRGVVTVPERELTILPQGAALDKRVGHILPEHGAGIGAFWEFQVGVVITGKKWWRWVQSSGSENIWGDETLTEKDDRVTTEQSSEKRDRADCLAW